MTLNEHQTIILNLIEEYKSAEETADRIFSVALTQLALMESEYGESDITNGLEAELRRHDKLSGLLY